MAVITKQEQLDRLKRIAKSKNGKLLSIYANPVPSLRDKEGATAIES